MPSTIATPHRQRHDPSNGASSPPGSVAGSSHTMASATSSSRVVTRLALEGKVKQGQDSVSMRMYLKITVPSDNAVPGLTIQLFPEENLKILNSLVHPLDATSAPYHFSSKTAPLLHNAAHALNLPQRLTQSYISLFPLTHSQNPSFIGNSSRSSSNGIHPPLLDEKYTGHILVSGYNVSYVLPREFPSLPETSITEAGRMYRRRNSFSDRSAYQFMAAIDMLVPLRMKPPRAPYLLSIPLPRCLSNNIKLRIFSRAPTSSSYASLSSMEDEPSSWDLTSDPHVTRNASLHTRSSSYAYSQYADDESSDSSVAGFSEGAGLLGTFPSTDQLRIRWAAPARAGGGSSQARRRVGVTEVKGDMTCAVLGRTVTQRDEQEAVLMKLDYKVTCKEVWHAGVATLLGMDISLDTNACELSWPDNAEPRWTVTGGAGFTGWDAGDTVMATQADPEPPSTHLQHLAHSRSRMDSAASSTSLLRTPLTTPSMPDYSFESGTSTPIGSMVSSLGSLPGPMSGSEGNPFQTSPETLAPKDCDPASPLTVHVNMNEIIGRHGRIPFTLHISGTVIVKPKFPSTTHALDDTEPPIPVVGLPRFRVIAADKEAVQTVVKNDATGANIEVFNLSGDLADAQTRKTILQRGSVTRCGTEGGRVAVRSIYLPSFGRTDTDQNRHDETLGGTVIPSRPGTPFDHLRRSRSSLRNPQASQPRLDYEGPQTIPHVRVTVTLLESVGDFMDEYVVCAKFPAPNEADLQPLEFGMALPPIDDPAKAPVLAIGDVMASIDGISAPVDLVKANGPLSGLGIQGLDEHLEGSHRKDWMNWIRFRTPCSPGSAVAVSYRVSVSEPKGKKTKVKDVRDVILLIPSFPLRITRLDVETEHIIPHHVKATNFRVRQQTASGWRLTQFLAEDLFRPAVTLRLAEAPSARPTGLAALLKRSLLWFLTLFSLLLLARSWQMQQQLEQLRSSAPHHLPTSLEAACATLTTEFVSTTITLISTVYAQVSETVQFPPTTAIDPGPTSLAVHPSPVLADAAELPSPQPSYSAPITTALTVALVNASPFPVPLPEPEAAPSAENAIAYPLSDYQLFRLLRSVPIPNTNDVKQAMQTGVHQLWYWCKVAFHYPLPPPE